MSFVLIFILFAVLAVSKWNQLEHLKAKLRSDRSFAAKVWNVFKFIAYPFIFPFVFFVLGFWGGWSELIPAIGAFEPSWWYWGLLALSLAVIFLLDRLGNEYLPGKFSDWITAKEATEYIKKNNEDGKAEALFIDVVVGIYLARVSVFYQLFLYFIGLQGLILWGGSLIGINIASVAVFVPSWLTIGSAFLFGPASVIAILIISVGVFIYSFRNPDTGEWTSLRWYIALGSWFQTWLGFATMALFGLFGAAILLFALGFFRTMHINNLKLEICKRLAAGK